MPSRWALRVSERVYRVLLVAYPKEFRDAYGPHMMQVFRDKCREAVERTGAIGFIAWWARTLLDLLFTAFAERRNASMPTGSRLEQAEHFLGLQEPQGSWRGIPTILYGGLQATLWIYMSVLLPIEDAAFDILRYWLIVFGLGQVFQGAGALFYAKHKTLAMVLRLTYVVVCYPLTGVVWALFGYLKYGTTGALLGVSAMLALGLVSLVIARSWSRHVRSSNARQG